MAPVLQGIKEGSDHRALIFDAKNDIVPFLKHIGVRCPVYSLNPLESRTEFPIAVRWDIAEDIRSPARAMNLVANLIPSEKSGGNQYFTDAARQVVTAVCESLIRHSPDAWQFFDLVFACLSQDRIREVLSRDEHGREVLAGFFGDERTAYQVFTTIYSRMAYYRPVAAMWQRTSKSISLREWLKTDSILIIGSNATVKTALDAINEQIVRVIVEEMDEQRNSNKRETWIWIDEARLCGPLLKNDILPYAAVKARSRGGCLVLGFQDIEGFREVAGIRIANELIAQCSHKALLRMESQESAKFASDLVGTFESIERFSSEGGTSTRPTRSVSEQRVNKQAVLTSEFYGIPLTSPKNGLTGYFLSPEFGVARDTIGGSSLHHIVTPSCIEKSELFASRKIGHQQLQSWSKDRRLRLRLLPSSSKLGQTCRKPRRIAAARAIE
jgi:type IV secretory pathway TraG/TraD family ATPase VirD4